MYIPCLNSHGSGKRPILTGASGDGVWRSAAETKEPRWDEKAHPLAGMAATPSSCTP